MRGWPGAALLAGLLGCAGGCSQTTGQTATLTQSTGQPPDFELRALDGSSVRLSEHLGKDVVLIDFWATYCEPCLRAMPALDTLYAKYRERGFVVLGVSIDSADSLLQVRADVQRLRVSFPILLDQDTRVVALYNPKTSAPFSVLIGRDGRILSKHEGYATGSAEALERDIQSALAAGGLPPPPGAAYRHQNRTVASSRMPSNGG